MREMLFSGDENFYVHSLLSSDLLVMSFKGKMYTESCKVIKNRIRQKKKTNDIIVYEASAIIFVALYVSSINRIWVS